MPRWSKKFYPEHQGFVPIFSYTTEELRDKMFLRFKKRGYTDVRKKEIIRKDGVTLYCFEIISTEDKKNAHFGPSGDPRFRPYRLHDQEATFSQIRLPYLRGRIRTARSPFREGVDKGKE